MNLYPRYWKLSITHDDVGEPWVIEAPEKPSPALRLRFDIQATPDGAPNNASLRIYGLGPKKEEMLQVPPAFIDKRKKHALHKVELIAGFRDYHGLIFSGGIWWSRVEQAAANRPLVMEMGQGMDDDLFGKHENGERGKGSTNKSILFSMLELFGPVGQKLKSQVEQALRKDDDRKQAKSWLMSIIDAGKQFKGNPVELAQHMLSKMGLTLVQDQTGWNILNLSKASAEVCYTLTPKTGLDGTPTPDKGRVPFRCLLIPPLGIGKTIKIESETYTGRAVIQRMSAQGDTHGDAWHWDATGMREF